MGKKEKDQATPAEPARITALDIQQKEFPLARFRGYRERDVDEFLDRLTEAWSSMVAENEKLRLQAGSGAMIGAPDLAEVGRQADEIIQRARDEAARIVREAQEGVPAMALEGSAGVEDRAAVWAFLTKERGFLRSLAALVQDHAEGVKGMARAAAARPAAEVASAGPPTPLPETPGSEPVSPSQPTSPSEPAAASGAEASGAEVVPAAEGVLGAATEVTRAEAEEPIRIDEAEPATVGAPDPKEDAEGGRSLRELFWGEE